MQEALFEDLLVVVTAPDHPLCRAPRVQLADTLSYLRIASPRKTQSGSYLFEFLRIREHADTPVRIVSSSLVLLRGMLARGDYVAIASKRQIEVDLQLGSLAQLPIELPGSNRPNGLTFREGWAPTPLQSAFVEILRAEALEADRRCGIT